MTVYYRTSASSEPYWATTSGGTPTVNTAAITSADDVVFDTNSNTTSSLPTAFNNCTASTFAGGLFYNNTAINCYGSLTLGSGLALVVGSGSMNFVATATGKTITTAGKNIGPTNFTGTGGGWTLQDTLDVSLSAINHTRGTLNTNNQTVRAGNIFISNLGSTTVNLGSSLIELGNASGTPWQVSGSVTVNAGTSTIRFTGSGTSVRTFSGGGKTYYNFEINSGAGSTITSIAGSNTFNAITTDKTVAHTLRLTAGTTTTVANFSVNGTSGSARVTLDTTGASASIAKLGGGVVNMGHMSIGPSISASPASTWFADVTCVDNGSNSGITFEQRPGGLFFGSNF